MRKMEPEAKSIFILPPSLEELRQRLVKRAQDSEEVIANRMNKAQREISHYNEYDYCLINDDFDQTLNDLWSIINANRHTRVIIENNEGETLENLLAGYDGQDDQS
jgi:guanylate kinase